MDYINKEYHGILGRYKVTKHLASGGMGHVYEATATKGNEIIIKFPTTEMPDGTPMSPSYHATVVEKLKVESQILKNFTRSKPQFIVKYIDESSNPDDFFLVIEKIHGKPVTKTITIGGLPENQVIHMSMDVLRGLEFLHKHNTIYRDMKPDNIMVAQDGHCIMIDFGAAKQGMTQSNSNKNTDNATGLHSPGWSCPDQSAGKASAECDLYAFGRVMFYMLTGIKPLRFTATTGRMTKKICDIKPNTSARLSNLVDDLIDPAHNRIHTANDLIIELGSLLSGSKPSSQQLRPQRLIPNQSKVGKPMNQIWPEARIVLQGIEYKISNRSGGSLMGKIHDEVLCQMTGGGCNRYEQGRNIFVGWKCPRGCRCSYNPGHIIDKHHMRIWRDGNGQICVVNNDSSRRSAINRGSKWISMMHHKKEVLKNHDQLALLYNERKGPYINFTFYER